jgi:cyclic-di-GMP-binding biofilm dispersal mediator protein
MQLQGKKFLVIGGSGVLGAEFVRQLHAAGAEILATAASNDSAAKIPAVAKVRLLLDLTLPASIDTLVTYLRDTEVAFDCIINASGVVGFGSAESVAGAEQAALVERMNRVNYLGPLQLLGGLMPLLRQAAATSDEAVLVNLTGVVASLPMAGLGHYSASKTAISGFLAAIAKELRKDKVRVIDARPGHTETGLATRPLFGLAPNFGAGMLPEMVVSRILRAIEGNETLLESEAFKA